MGEVIDHEPETGRGPINPFAKEQPDHLSAGAVAIESERAIAEAQGRLIVAKKYPRDQARAFAMSMASCRRASLAKVANYKFPRGGQSVEGPSIRLAEELARLWGNLDFGLRELSRRPGESEMEAYAWDLETNVLSRQTFTVRHIRDTKGGGKALVDERDIYEMTANNGSRRLRARILAILPPDLVDAAVEECKRTQMQGAEKSLVDAVRDMTQAFARIGVTVDVLTTRLGRSLDTATPEDVYDMRSIYQSIKDGQSSIRDWFAPKEGADPLDLPKAAKPIENELPKDDDTFPGDKP